MTDVTGQHCTKALRPCDPSTCPLNCVLVHEQVDLSLEACQKRIQEAKMQEKHGPKAQGRFGYGNGRVF